MLTSRWARCAASSEPCLASIENPLPSDRATLDDLLAELQAETPDVKEKAGEYSRAGVVFAARPDSNSVELRLGPDIAEAALRTPQTGASSRGEDWIRLEAVDWKDASDRLEAWYRVAWRIAGKQTARR